MIINRKTVGSGSSVLVLDDRPDVGLSYVCSPIFQGVVLPEKFEISLQYCMDFSGMFGNTGSYTTCCWEAKEIIVHGSHSGLVKNLSNMFGRCTEITGFWGNQKCAIEKITLDFDTSNVNNYSYFFYIDTRNALREINGVIDFSSVMTDYNANGFNVRLDNLTHIEFEKNSLSVNFTMSRASTLHDNVLVELGNVLNESVTGKTLTLHATPKTRCSSLMGSVTMDDSNTYHVFTADASGTVTLQDFITNTKGWTLA